MKLRKWERKKIPLEKFPATVWTMAGLAKRKRVYFIAEPGKLTAFGGKDARANFEAHLREKSKEVGRG